MRISHENLSETHITGKDTQEWIVRAVQCPALGLHRIAHVGIAKAATPYRMVRTNLSGSYLLGVMEGEGRILLDGRWQVCRAGMACLAPPHVVHAFHAVSGVPWKFCWVRYEQAPEQPLPVTASSPVMARFDVTPLFAAIQGLYFEVNHDAATAAAHHWVELIQTYVLRFARPWKGDDRLGNLWEMVAAHLNRDWTLEMLSRHVHCSGEHLRRLCRRHLGRSPMHQVTYLRMQRAATLLASTSDKVETIATAVGYENPFVFSNTFKRWIGWRPSDYRNKHGNSALAKRSE